MLFLLFFHLRFAFAVLVGFPVNGFDHYLLITRREHADQEVVDPGIRPNQGAALVLFNGLNDVTGGGFWRGQEQVFEFLF